MLLARLWPQGMGGPPATHHPGGRPMRRPVLTVLPLLLVALACTAGIASAQVQPGYSGGGVTITRSPEDGAAVPASLTRTLSRTDVLAARRWLVGATAPVQSAA